MNNEHADWNKLKEEHLRQIQKALRNVNPQAAGQIMEDVSEHLEQRYHEIPGEQRNPESLAKIIQEMGPADEYIQYLLPDKAVQFKKRNLLLWLLPAVGIIAVCIAAFLVIFLNKSDSKPVVIQTTPKTFSADVDPALDHISVTFDQPMMNFSWSWVGGGEHYPHTTGDPSYDSPRKTCTLPVKLKPGRWYWIGINSVSYRHFQTEKRVSARPYVILFATADEHGNPTQIPADYLEEAKRINSK